MKKASLLILLIAFFTILSAQAISKKMVANVANDGENLFKLELLTRHSADKLYESNAMEGLSGFVAFMDGGLFNCIYWKGEGAARTVVYHFTALDPEKPKFIQLDATAHALSEKEQTLANIKVKALAVIRGDKAYFKIDRGITLSLHILENESSYFAYLIANQRTENYIPIGNDFRLEFDKNGTLIKRAKLRSKLVEIPTDVEPDKNGRIITFHDNTEVGSAIISPTDICNLLLYSAAPAKHEHHMTSRNFVCVYDLGQRNLLVQKR